MRPYRFRTVNGLLHLVMTAAEWESTPEEYRGTITDPRWTGWPVGTKTAIYWDQEHGTCLAPVLIEG